MRVFDEIAKVEAEHIQEVLEAVIYRYEKLFPDWEVNFFSIPRSVDRNSHIDKVIRMLQSFKEQKTSAKQ